MHINNIKKIYNNLIDFFQMLFNYDYINFAY